MSTADNINDTWDWGFNAVTLEELDIIQETTSKLEESDAESRELQTRLDAVYKAIQPLLNNLKKDPAKDYLYWKGEERMRQIEAFSDHLDSLYLGK